MKLQAFAREGEARALLKPCVDPRLLQASPTDRGEG
jgi:hypothetical protein